MNQAATDDAISVIDYSIKLLRDRLAVLAGDYRQDAIALTLGESELIAPRAHGIPNIGGIGAVVGEGVTA